MKHGIALLFTVLTLGACFDSAPTTEELMNDPKLRDETAKLCAKNLGANTDKENKYYETCKNLRHAMMECVFGECK